MRLSQDSSSWKAGGVIRRDHRADTHSSPDALPASNRKDKRRWCKGKPGREHQYDEPQHLWGWSRYRMSRCKLCGKKRYVTTSAPPRPTAPTTDTSGHHEQS